VTGARDLLDEMRCAATHVTPDDVLRMVTSAAADVLRLDDAGRIRVGASADLMVIPARAETAAAALLACWRSDVSLVLRRGTPVVGEPELASAFSLRGIHVRSIQVDGRVKLAEAGLARRIERCTVSEPGVCASA
jgi:cytosine/adenosine deaminase-related metal-dependent hydrolase